METKKVQNIGIIMDGNRRWARQQGLTSIFKGHSEGAKKFIDFCRWCQKRDIPYITSYAFSFDNWKRTKLETDALFRISLEICRDYLQECIDDDARIHILGDWSRFSPRVAEAYHDAEARTAHCKTTHICLGVSYGGKNEYVRVAQKVSADVRDGKLAPENINETTLLSYLDMGDAPDMDLIIRTGGNHRLSGFFPWQSAYSEIYFTDTLWPAFDEAELDRTLAAYEQVQINKGK